MDGGPRRLGWGWSWWLLGYALLAPAVWLGYRGVVVGRPAWLAALFKGRHPADSVTQRVSTRSTAVAWDLTKVTRVQDLRPGTPAEAIIRRFGPPHEWGYVARLSERDSYCIDVSEHFEGHDAPLFHDPGWVHWVYSRAGRWELGPSVFLELRDNKLVRVFEGSLVRVDGD